MTVITVFDPYHLAALIFVHRDDFHHKDIELVLNSGKKHREVVDVVTSDKYRIDV